MPSNLCLRYPGVPFRRLEDNEILLKFRDPASRNLAFNQLVRKYQGKVYWHVRKMVVDHDDADDLTQDVFIKVWKHLENFRQDAALFTWIYRIATNECLNFLGCKRRNLLLPLMGWPLCKIKSPRSHIGCGGFWFCGAWWACRPNHCGTAASRLR